MTVASIVVPTRGGAQRLPQLFDCLARQADRDWEAVVVIDGDVDGSEAVVRAWSETIPLRAICFPENRGRSAALNAGFGAAVGRVLIRCDDDLRPSPDYVANHVMRHAAGPVGAVGLYRNQFPPTSYARAYGEPADLKFRRDAYDSPPAQQWRYWAGNVSTTREVHDLVGDYDTNFRAYGWEDVDWGYRLHSLSVPVILAPELETCHHVAATTAAERAQRAFYSGAARSRFEAKHGAGMLPPMPPRHGAWNRTVHLTAEHLTERRLGCVGPLVDRCLRLTPNALGRKAVALLVESAAIAGHSRPEHIQHVI